MQRGDLIAKHICVRDNWLNYAVFTPGGGGANLITTKLARDER
jgi:hypothetical protein